MCLWWGGEDTNGYEVTVVAENQSHWVVECAAHGFEVLRRSDRDTLLFDSYEDGLRDKQERKARWEAERLEYEREIAGKTRAAPKPDSSSRESAPMADGHKGLQGR